MHFGFSYIGAVFLIMLLLPNLLWTKNRPQDYEAYAKNENRLLLWLERIGEAAVSFTVLFLSDLDLQFISPWVAWFLIACAAMLLYEFYWIRYFRGPKTMKTFYQSLLGIPVPGAVLPVFAFLCLGIYSKDPILLLCVILLGIGHIGIHWKHKKEIQ